MEIRDTQNICIYAPLSPIMNSYETDRLMKLISFEKRNTAIDLNYVYDCTVEFIESLKRISREKTISIFNIPSDIFALFNFMKVDKFVNLYVSEADFKENLHQLINRNFHIVSFLK